MKLWISDFLSDTLDLDAREVGAYLLLLMAMWKAGGTLSSDEGKLRRMARCGRDWPRVWAGISHHFEEVDGRLTNRRLARELSEAVTKQEVNRQSGALGGKAKALKDKEARLANAIASQSQSLEKSIPILRIGHLRRRRRGLIVIRIRAVPSPRSSRSEWPS